MKMGNTDTFRIFYPAILTLTYEELAELCQKLDPSSIIFWTGVYLDLQRNRKYARFEGWYYPYNPFLAMDTSFNVNDRPIPEDVLSATHHMVAKALAWLGIGVWPIAEKYFKTALSINFTTHNIESALICGANLGLCYLAGEDIESAYNLTEQLLPLAIETHHTYPGTRIATIKQICLARCNKWQDLVQENSNLKKIGFDRLDDSLNDILIDIYESTGLNLALTVWSREWEDMQKLLAGDEIELVVVSMKDDDFCDYVLEILAESFNLLRSSRNSFHLEIAASLLGSIRKIQRSRMQNSFEVMLTKSEAKWWLKALDVYYSEVLDYEPMDKGKHYLPFLGISRDMQSLANSQNIPRYTNTSLVTVKLWPPTDVCRCQGVEP